jgi:hypothetical protein
MLFLCLATSMAAQDSLRTYGPRVGIDIARFAYLLADPAEIGAEASLDAEVYRNFYPVLEIGYSSIQDSLGQSTYSSQGAYARIGLDYNLLHVSSPSVHHSITVGFRYAASVFSHRAEDITVPSAYWGDVHIDTYENNLSGHFIELVGGIKVELLSNLFLGWNVRYRVLLNPGMDSRVTPLYIPGYGNGVEDRGFGISYTLSYKFPIFKR